eukprot:1072416-Rhodomonas_salina.1
MSEFMKNARAFWCGRRSRFVVPGMDQVPCCDVEDPEQWEILPAGVPAGAARPASEGDFKLEAGTRVRCIDRSGRDPPAHLLGVIVRRNAPGVVDPDADDDEFEPLDPGHWDYLPTYTVRWAEGRVDQVHCCDVHDPEQWEILPAR